MEEQEKFIKKRAIVYNYPKKVKEVLIMDSMGFGRNGGRKGNVSEDVEKKDRVQNLKKIKRNCRRLAFANDLGRVHLVLTYADNMQDIDKADEQFKEFMKSIHKVYPELKYLATRELQKRGAVHYHTLLNQRVDVKKVEKLWKHGFVKIVDHPNQMKAVMYALKYIQKEVGQTVFTTKNGHTKKAYLSSHGMKQEVEGCILRFCINRPDAYVMFLDKINFMVTNLTEGWDLEFQIPIGKDEDGNEKTLYGRSILKCAAC